MSNVKAIDRRRDRQDKKLSNQNEQSLRFLAVASRIEFSNLQLERLVAPLVLEMSSTEKKPRLVTVNPFITDRSIIEQFQDAYTNGKSLHEDGSFSHRFEGLLTTSFAI